MEGATVQASLVVGAGRGGPVMDQPEDSILEGKFKLYFRIVPCLPWPPTLNPICNLAQEVLAGVN